MQGAQRRARARRRRARLLSTHAAAGRTRGVAASRDDRSSHGTQCVPCAAARQTGTVLAALKQSLPADAFPSSQPHTAWHRARSARCRHTRSRRELRLGPTRRVPVALPGRVCLSLCVPRHVTPSSSATPHAMAHVSVGRCLCTCVCTWHCNR